MKLVTSICISGFRSIRDAHISLNGDLIAFAGLNNSGKSNVLRALNAFFNDETDNGKRLNVDQDYFRPDLAKKKRKIIRISVAFELPATFRFRKGLEPVQALLSGSSFTITKEWTRNEPSAIFFLNNNSLGLEDRQKLTLFLQLIKFRYVPNRVLPTELIRSEHQSLRNVLVRRLAGKAKHDNKAFEGMRSASARMIESLAKRFAQACPGEGTVSLATPNSWQDLAFTFGYRLARDGIEIEDDAQGSGIQSLLMLETLYLIDQDYFQQFGWKQASIWGVEEPESSLHASLEARVAAYLAEVATQKASRLQVFCTTHSDLLVQYAGCTVVVKNDVGKSTFEPTMDPRGALKLLSSSGIARWVHPVLFWPLDPIILVEGKFDREFFEEAIRFIRLRRSVRIVDLPDLDDEVGGSGVERIHRYVKDNASAIRSRRADAPLVVVLDWDAKNKVAQFTKLVGDTARYKVLAWSEESANPNAGKSFKGTERFHSDRVLELAISMGAPIARKARKDQPDEYVVAASEYPEVKLALASIVRDGLQETDLVHAEAFIREVLTRAGVL